MMFWDRVAFVYDIYVNVINRKTHEQLRKIVAEQISPEDIVLECACGTGLLSKVIASNCRQLTATDVSREMLKKAEKNCSDLDNITYETADITALSYADNSFDKVVAGNVIHLLDDPLKAMNELNRVCKQDGTLIIPSYMNREKKKQDSTFISVLDKAGADFKQQFTVSNYRQFFIDAGYTDVEVVTAKGWIDCAVAMMKKRTT